MFCEIIKCSYYNITNAEFSKSKDGIFMYNSLSSKLVSHDIQKGLKISTVPLKEAF